MSSKFHIVMKNIKEGKHMFMYVVLHGIAQIPGGKAQNLAQNELKISYSDEKKQRYLCVDVCCFSISSGEGSKSSSK